MKCPCCGAAELVHEIKSIEYVYLGYVTSIPDVEGDYCPSCGEVLLDARNGDRYTAMAAAFEHSVQAPRSGARTKVS